MSTTRVFLLFFCIDGSLLNQVSSAGTGNSTVPNSFEVNTLPTRSTSNDFATTVPLHTGSLDTGSLSTGSLGSEANEGDEETDTTATEATPTTDASPDQKSALQAFQDASLQWSSLHLGTLALVAPVNSKNELLFGWHVAVYSKLEKPYEQICGASLVTKNAAISAAHCFWDDAGLIPAEQFAVAAGNKVRRWSSLQIHQSDVSEIIVPPRFLGVQTNFQDDIAVVKFATIFKYNFGVKPLCVDFDLQLERKQLMSGNPGTIVGFGLTEANGDPSPVLNYQQLPYVDIRDCINASDPNFLKYLTSDKICAGDQQTGKSRSNFPQHLTSDKICAGDQQTGRALCRGDSGGGLVFFEGAIPYLRGVASAAPRNNNKCNAFAIGSFTHVRTHRTFLRDHIPGLEEECRTVFAKLLAETSENQSKDGNQSGETRPIENVTSKDHTSLSTPSDSKDKVITTQLFQNTPQFTQVNTQNESDDEAETETALDDSKPDTNKDDQKAGLFSTPEINLNENHSDSEVTEDPVNHDGARTKNNKDFNYMRTLPQPVQKVGAPSAPAYQWHVTVYSKAKIPYRQICGGTLVKTDVFISAAHCFYSGSRILSATRFAAAAGKTYRSWGDVRDKNAQYSDVKRLQFSPNFSEVNNKLRSCYQHDVAVATLASPFTYAAGVKPACVDFNAEFDRHHLRPGSFGKFLGYGHTEDNCESYPHLLYRELPYVHLGCNSDFSLTFFEIKPDGDVCDGLVALFNDERIPTSVKVKAPCNTDSGGGLVYLDGSSTDLVPFLRGVATATLATTKCNLYIIDSFVQLRQEREFLKTVIPGLEKECDVAYPSTDFVDTSEEETLGDGTTGISPNSTVGVVEENGMNTEGKEVNRSSGVVPVGPLQPDSSKPNRNASGLNSIKPGSNFASNVNEPVETTSDTKPNYNEASQSSEIMPNRSLNNDLPSGIQMAGNPGFQLLNSVLNLGHVPLTDASKNRTNIITWKKKNQTTTEKPTEQSLVIPALGSTNVSSFWWHVGVYSKAWTPYALICGGSLIKRNVVLSAAHCFWSDDFGAQSPTRFAVAAGKFYSPWMDSRDKEAQYSHVRELIFPDRFMGIKTNFQDDIAVVRLSTPFEYGAGLRPICLDFDMVAEKQELKDGRLGMFAVRWGLTEDNGQPSQGLSFIELPQVNIKECIRDSASALLKYITSDKICAGDQKKGTYLCRSDSGGGLAINGTHPILRGIASHAHNDVCQSVTLIRFTHVASHAMFLKEHVEDIERECFDVYGMGSHKVEGGRNRGDGLDVNRGVTNYNLYCNCNCDNSSRYRP